MSEQKPKRFSGMTAFHLTVEKKCPSTHGFVGLNMLPGHVEATTEKYKKQIKQQKTGTGIGVPKE